MEMNTRIRLNIRDRAGQWDRLGQEQIKIAAGEKLSFQQKMLN